MHLGHVYSYSLLRSSAALAPGSLAALDLQSGRKGERSGVTDVHRETRGESIQAPVSLIGPWGRIHPHV